MTTQKQSGKAFEFAVVTAFHSLLGQDKAQVIDDQAIRSARADFNTHSQARQEENLTAASAAVEQIIKFEPHLSQASNKNSLVQISLQSDQAGAIGDVRDVVLRVPEQNWEIGISAKHQHEALKHSRLSRNIDFGKKWLGFPCSSEYFAGIDPIFAHLAELKAQGFAWSQIVSKDKEIYVPILLAFQNELIRLEKEQPGTVARNLVSYLIGMKDFYKVIMLRKQTKLQVFNFNGTLNTAFRSVQPESRLDRLKLPTRIVEIAFRRSAVEESTTTLDMICDAGWQISFRLHSASTRVETSLKFDINIVGRPNNLTTLSAMW